LLYFGTLFPTCCVPLELRLFDWNVIQTLRVSKSNLNGLFETLFVKLILFMKWKFCKAAFEKMICQKGWWIFLMLSSFCFQTWTDSFKLLIAKLFRQLNKTFLIELNSIIHKRIFTQSFFNRSDEMALCV